MQKIIEDREKRKKKWIRAGKISLLTILAVVVLVRIFCSSYAFCNWYLPLVSYSLGIRITADEVKFTPFSNKRHLNFRGLQLEIEDKMIFTAQRFKTKLSLTDLVFHQRYSLDNVQVEKSSLVISDLRRTKDQKERSGLKKLRIGSVTVNDLSFRYAPERSAVYGKAFFDEVKIDSLLPDRHNTVELRSFLAWDLPDSSMVNLPVSSKIRFMLDQELFPVLLNMDIETQKFNGNLYKHDLPGLRMKAFLDCRINDRDMLTIRNLIFQQFDDDRETFKVNAHGSYDIDAQSGSLEIKADAERMSIPYLSMECVPEDLGLHFAGILRKNGNMLSLDSDLDLEAKAIRKNKKTVIPAPKVHLTSCLTWNISEKKLTLSKCRLQAHSNGLPLLAVRTSENFAFSINQDTSWSIAPENSTLQLSVKDFPLAFFNEFLPFQFKNGTLAFNYDLQVNAEKKCIHGTIKGSAGNVELQYNGATFFKQYPMQFEGKLHSRGLDRISVLEIPGATLTCGENNFAAVKLNGDIQLQTKKLSLKGTLNTDMQELTAHFVPIDRNNSKKFLSLLGNCTRQNEHTLQLELDAKNQSMDFAVKSILKKLTLPMMQQEIDLTLTCAGRFTRKQDQQQIRFNELSLSAPGVLNLNGNAVTYLPDGIHEIRLNLSRISPDVLRGFLIAASLQNTTKQNWLRKMDFKNLTASANFLIDPEKNNFRISNVAVKMLPRTGGDATLKLNKPITGTLSPGTVNDTPATAVFRKFPLEYFNTLTSDQCSIQIKPAKLDCTVQLAFRNTFQDIPFRAEGMVDSLSCTRHDTLYDFGSCTFKGEALLEDNFERITYKNAIWELNKAGQQQILSGKGDFIFGFPYTGNMVFQIPQVNHSYIATFIPLLETRLAVKESLADTSVRIHTDQNYAQCHLILDRKIRKLALQFPGDAKEIPPELQGDLHLDLTYNAPKQILALNRSYLTLRDENKNLRYHAELHGEWDGSKHNRSSCSFISNAADLRTLYLAFKAQKQQAKQDAGTAAPDNSSKPDQKTKLSPKEKAVAAIKETLESENEPPAIKLNDFSTKLDVNLKNWTYTDHISFAMNGAFTVDNNIFHANELCGTFNKAPFLLDAYADLGQQNGWIIKLLWKIRDLDIAPVIQAVGGDELKERKITGLIDNMELEVATRGVTNKSLDKNLDFSMMADFSKFSFPLVKDEDFSAWQLLILPLTVFPRLYDLIIPEGKVRNKVQKFLGGTHIDVLAGKRNIELDRGMVRLVHGNECKTDLTMEKFLFSGPILQVASKEFMINPFHNRMQAKILTKFGGTVYPVLLTGKMDEPQVKIPNLFGNVLKGSLKRMNVFQEDDPVWSFEEVQPQTTPAEPQNTGAEPQTPQVNGSTTSSPEQTIPSPGLTPSAP